MVYVLANTGHVNVRHITASSLKVVIVNVSVFVLFQSLKVEQLNASLYSPAVEPFGAESVVYRKQEKETIESRTINSCPLLLGTMLSESNHVMGHKTKPYD